MCIDGRSVGWSFGFIASGFSVIEGFICVWLPPMFAVLVVSKRETRERESNVEIMLPKNLIKRFVLCISVVSVSYFLYSCRVLLNLFDAKSEISHHHVIGIPIFCENPRNVFCADFCRFWPEFIESNIKIRHVVFNNKNNFFMQPKIYEHTERFFYSDNNRFLVSSSQHLVSANDVGQETEKQKRWTFKLMA